MATVTGLTAARMLAIEGATVVDGAFDSTGHLILERHDGTTFDAGVMSAATSAQKGIVELATPAECTTGTATDLAVTPEGLKTVADTKQPSDADLTAFAALAPANDDIVQRKGGVWINRTMAQLLTDILALPLAGGTLTGNLTMSNANVAIATPGKTIQIAEGSNAKMGTQVLNGTTAVTVTTTAVAANSRIFLTTQVPGGTLGVPVVVSRVAGTSFNIRSSVSGDVSTVAWWIVDPI